MKKTINAYFYPTQKELADARRLRERAQFHISDEEHSPFDDVPPFDVESDDPNPFQRKFAKALVKVFRKMLNDRETVRTPFFWVTHKGKILFPSAMATPHLFYTFRMIYNNTVPSAFRVGEFKRYPDIQTWGEDYRANALTALATEIATREDLEEELAFQLEDIVGNIGTVLAFRI